MEETGGGFFSSNQKSCKHFETADMKATAHKSATFLWTRHLCWGSCLRVDPTSGSSQRQYLMTFTRYLSKGFLDKSARKAKKSILSKKKGISNSMTLTITFH